MPLSNGFANTHEWLNAVINASVGRSIDRRLLVRGAAGADEQQTTADVWGGFMVPEEMAPTLSEVGVFDPTINLVTTIPMGSGRVKIPGRDDKTHTTSQTGGFTVDARTETQAETATRGAVDAVYLEAHSYTGLVYSTNELLEDSPIAASLLIRRGLAEQLGHHLLDQKLNGSGVGQLEGILNSPCKVTVSRGARDVFNMIGRAWRYDQCIWLANNANFAEFVAGAYEVLGSNSDRPAYSEVNNTVCGRPIYLTEFLPTGDSADSVVLWQPSEYLLGVRAETFRQSFYVRFAENESAFSFVWRGDGRMWWRSALTPKNGANTLSPVVTLDAA